ncbi:MAG: hypothetical protein JKX94_04960 [Sneathiella sp.]|nr:hypothetical protein [Sneathiella sp.]
MGKNILCLAVFWLMVMTGTAHAITYNVNRTIDDGTVIGFIETDGTLGSLSAANITNWMFTLTAPTLNGGSPDVIDYATQVRIELDGPGVVATATQITFDFSVSSARLLFLGGDLNYWCLEAIGACENRTGELIGQSEFGRIAAFAERQGQVVIASISTIPLPIGLPLFAGGLSLMALLGWHRKRNAAVTS